MQAVPVVLVGFGVLIVLLGLFLGFITEDWRMSTGLLVLGAALGAGGILFGRYRPAT